MTMEHRFIVDAEVCGGCKLCELMCSFVHEGSFSYTRSKIRVKRDDATGVDIPSVCHHCVSPPCLDSCPEGAIVDLGEKGVQILMDKCTGCLLCLKACPYNAFTVDADGKPTKCNLCEGKPECIVICPTQAIQLSDGSDNTL